MAPHTPGPWSMPNPRIPYVYAPKEVGCIVHRMPIGEEARDYVDDCKARWLADARLIAAAPDYHERAYILAMLVLQSEAYRTDADLRDAVDSVLATHREAEGQ